MKTCIMALMRLAILVAASLVATVSFAQDGFPEFTKIQLGAVQDAAKLFKNSGMDIRLPDVGARDKRVEKPYWSRLTCEIAAQLPSFFKARAKRHQAALDEWWKLYVCYEPVDNIEASLAFSGGGWRRALETLVRETCYAAEAAVVRDCIDEAEPSAKEDARVLLETARVTAWVEDVPENDWIYDVVEDAKKAGLVRLYPNRLIRGPIPYTRKDCAYVVVNAHKNLLGVFTPRPDEGRDRYFCGRRGLSQGLLNLLAEVRPEIQRISGDYDLIRKDFTRLSAWLDRGRWSEKLNRPYLAETPPGHWADAAMSRLYDAGILVGRDSGKPGR